MICAEEKGLKLRQVLSNLLSNTVIVLDSVTLTLDAKPGLESEHLLVAFGVEGTSGAVNCNGYRR